MTTSPDRGCVLIVDDDADIREALEDALEAVGYRTVTAANGAEAKQLLTTLRPGAIILDLWMPIMDGNRLYAALQADPVLATVPVVVSTSVPRDAPKGVVVLPKPIDLTALMRWLAIHCTVT